jgi:Dioxygenase
MAASGSPVPSTRLSRRRVLGWLGGLGLAALIPGCADDESSSSPAAATTSATEETTATTAPDCVLTPEVTEGPYYLDLDLMRSDITEGRSGLPFDLQIKVVDADSCEPIKDVAVDVWHFDAEGVYSGVQGDDGTFLRGIQVTDATGNAAFQTIFPGWVHGPGRPHPPEGHPGRPDLDRPTVLRRRDPRHRLRQGALLEPRPGRRPQRGRRHLRPDQRLHHCRHRRRSRPCERSGDRRRRAFLTRSQRIHREPSERP